MTLQPGARLGSFEVLGPLGAGGMGEVYRARDKHLGREVAIKTLPRSLAQDPARASRFAREARILAAINHPSVAAIYGAEEFDGVPCIIMEFVPGQTLSEVLACGVPPLDQALDIAGQIAEALEAAHERGVVHRDLKPSNIKVTPEGKVKVLDLGLAKAVELPAAEDDLSNSPTVSLEQTRPGTILGTVEFMSPEQARGKDVDKRTDIWAFGCILFEMLSGRRAFTGESAADVITAILSREPDWSALPPSAPERLRELLSHCLQKDPRQRLRDLGDARHELQAALSGTWALAPTAQLPPRRRKLLLSGALLALLVVGFWTALQLARRGASASASLPERKYLAIFLKDLSGDENGQLIADGFAETVSARVGRDPRIQVVTSSAVAEARQRNADPYAAARRLHANLLVHGTLQRQESAVRFTFFVENLENSRKLLSDQITGPRASLFQIQDSMAEKVARTLGVAQLPAASASGLQGGSQQDRYLEALGLMQRYERASAVDEAIRILQGLIAEGARSALVQAALARADLYKYDLTKQKTWADQALAACAAAREINADLPEVHITLGEILNRTGKPVEALAEFNKALELQPDYASAMIGRGDAEKALGKKEDSERSYQRAIRLQPGNWTAYNSLGKLYFQKASYREAADAFSRVTELSPDNSRAFFNLGAAYYYMQRPDDARAAFRRSIQLQPTGFAYSNLGTLEFSVGNYGASAKAFEEAVQRNPDDYQVWFNLGDAYRWSPGMRVRSIKAYEKAIELGRQALEVNPKDAGLHATLARSFAKIGKPEQARVEIELALELDPKSPEILYRAAVVAAVSGRKQDALDSIARAASAGYPVALIAREPEFGMLRGEPAFQKAITPGPNNRSS